MDLAGGDFVFRIGAGSRRKRGRPKCLDDVTLVHRRDIFHGILQNEWGLIGWELLMATRITDVQTALAQVAEWQHELTPFVRTSIATADAARLRITRQEHVAVGELLRAAYESEQEKRQADARAAAALQQLNSDLKRLSEKDGNPPIGTSTQLEILPGQISSLEAECARRKRELDLAVDAYRSTQRDENLLRERLADEEAYFAQAELLRFTLSGRYSLVPLNFANAMAGLPFVGWRQSFQRCARHRPPSTKSTRFRQFLIISNAITTARRVKRPVLEILRARLKAPRHQNDAATLELKKNWYYISEAVPVGEANECADRPLPFRITAEYFRRLQSRSALDVLREEEQRLQQ